MKSFPKLTGSILIGIGIILMLNSLGYMNLTPWSIIRIYWPLLLIYLGIDGLLKQKMSSNISFNSLLAISGLILLGDNLNLYDFNVFYLLSKFWPVVLIVLGISLILKPNKK